MDHILGLEIEICILLGSAGTCGSPEEHKNQECIQKHSTKYLYIVFDRNTVHDVVMTDLVISKYSRNTRLDARQPTDPRG